MSNFNKLITNKPVSLTEQEVANLSETLSAVRTAGGGGGGQTKTYIGDGTNISINQDTGVVRLTPVAEASLYRDIPSAISSFPDANQYAKKVDYFNKNDINEMMLNKQDKLLFGYDDGAISSIDGHKIAGTGGVTGDYYSASNPSGFINSDQAEAQIIAKKYITSSVSELDNFYSKSQTSGANEIANAIKDFVTEDLLEATSGELKNWVSENYYDKTETSSKEALETAFGSKQDNLTQEQLLAISNVSSKLNTTAFSTVSGTFALKSEIPTTVAQLTDSGNYYKKTETSSKTEIENAFDNIPKYILNGDSNITATSAQDGKNIRWDLAVNATPVVTDTTLTGDKGIYTHKTSNSGEWCVELVQSAYEAINDVQNKLDTTAAAQTYQPKGDYVTDTELQNTSAAITALIPSTAGLASEADLQIVSAGVNAVSGELPNYLKVTAYEADSGKFALKSEIPTVPTKVSDLTDSANYYKTTETSSKDELSTEFAKYVTTALLDTVSSTLDDDIEFVSGQVDNKVNKPTEGNKTFVYQTTGTTTSGWIEIPVEWEKTGRNFAIGVENEFVESTTDILLQGYQNSGTYVDFAQGYQNSAFQYVISQGYRNIGNYESMAQGYINTAINIALAQGSTNSANYQAFAQGILNKAKYDSLAQGHSNSAVDQSIAQGLENTAYHYSFAQGYLNKADMQSFAQGANNIASYYSQTIGHNLIASGFDEDDYYYGLFAIGGYNATTSNALFVVGNGSSFNGTPTRSDAFVIYKDGSVSAKGDISANGVKLGGGTTLTLPVNVGSGNTITGNSLGAIGNNNTVGEKSMVLSITGASATSNSFAFGDDNYASANSMAVGWHNSAKDYSYSFGHNSLATNYSFIAGDANTANNYAGTIGRGLSIDGGNYGGLAVGRWNNVSSNALFVVGNGTNSTDGRKDAFVVYTDGTIQAGNGTYANSGACFTQGAWTFAEGQMSHAEGVSTSAIGYGIHAEGCWTKFSAGSAVPNSIAVSNECGVFVGGFANATTSHNYGEATAHSGVLAVYGNGYRINNSNITERDAYILYRDGTVKAKDFIAGGDTLSANYPVPKSVPNTADNTLKVQRMFVVTGDDQIMSHLSLANGEGCIFFEIVGV